MPDNNRKIMSTSEGLCRAIREEGLLIRLLDGELSPTEEHKVLTHLRTCHECLGLTADLLYTDDRLIDMFARHREQREELQKKQPVSQFMIELDKLPVGKEVERDLLSEDGQLLIASGTVLTEPLIQSLQRRGISKLAVRSAEIDEPGEAEEHDGFTINIAQITGYVAESGIEPIVSEYVRKQCATAVEKSFRDLEKDGALDVREVDEAASQVTEEVLSKPQIALSMADLILMDKSLHAHSVNVLIMFLMIARAMGHPAGLIREHASAALLHDIGRIVLRHSRVSSGLKPDDEREDLEHPEAGYAYLWNVGGFSESSLKMVMNHHERYDGRGYPRKIKGTGLSDWDQILILANTYDMLTWDRATGIRKDFHKALGTIIQDGGKFARKGIVRAVIKTFGHYPPGSYVKMNNGEIGMVTRAYPGSPLKPQVSLIYDPSGRRHSKPRQLELVHNQSSYIIGPAQVEVRT